MSEFSELQKRTIAIYEKNAQAWDRHRPRLLIEKTWLDKFVQPLATGAHLLDVGCGAGEPISSYLLGRGFCVTGIDSSPAMIDICRSRNPSEKWLVMDMRELSMDEKFDGIIAWDSFFHLNPDEQRRTLQRFIVHLKPYGNLLLSVGHEAGEVLGRVEGETVYHSSLSAQEYQQILHSAGFESIDTVLEDEHCDCRSVLLAMNLKADPNRDG